MSIKCFCDGCGSEITRNYATSHFMPRLEMIGGNIIRLEVMATINGDPSRGELCFDCLRSVFKHGEEVEEI